MSFYISQCWLVAAVYNQFKVKSSGLGLLLRYHGMFRVPTSELKQKNQKINIGIYLMDNVTKVLTLMKEAGKPVSAGEIEKASDLDRQAIDKAFKTLKGQGLIVSPVRCKWEPVPN